MKDRISTILHQGRKIIYVDFSNLSPTKHVELIDEQLAYTLTQTEKKVLFLVNLHDSRLSERAKGATEKLRATLRDLGYHFKLAVFGMTELQELIIQETDTTYFTNDIEDAKCWLVTNFNLN